LGLIFGKAQRHRGTKAQSEGRGAGLPGGTKAQRDKGTQAQSDRQTRIGILKIIIIFGNFISLNSEIR
jgi:hypothetical protein